MGRKGRPVSGRGCEHARGMRPTTMLGYSAASAEDIVRHALAGRPLRELPGDFVVVAEDAADPTRCAIVTSAVGVRPYFHATGPDRRLVHGEGLFDVASRAGLPWRWDRQALVAFVFLLHTLDEDTLHPGVRRLPPCAILRADGPRITVERQERPADVFGDA